MKVFTVPTTSFSSRNRCTKLAQCHDVHEAVYEATSWTTCGCSLTRATPPPGSSDPPGRRLMADPALGVSFTDLHTGWLSRARL